MRRHRRYAPIHIIAILMIWGLTACTRLAVQTDPAQAPSFSSSILWLNDYFRSNDIAVRIAEDRVHYETNRSGSHSGVSTSVRRYRRTQYVHFQYVNGTILLLSTATTFARFNVPDSDRESVIQRMVVVGLKFNQAGRIRDFACVAGNTRSCPTYPDDGHNRTVDPHTAPCLKRRCVAPR